MKINDYLKRSLSRQFVALMGTFLFVFVMGSAILLFSIHTLNQSYYSQRTELRTKELIIREIKEDFDQAFFDARGYLALKNPALKKRSLSEEKQIRALIKKYNQLDSSKEDKLLGKKISEFTDYYFVKTLPLAFRDFENGNMDAVIKTANTEATAKVSSFQNSLQAYLKVVNQNLDNNFKRLIKLQTFIQSGFLVFIMVILLMVFRIIRIIFRKVGQPLSQLTEAANDIASGTHMASIVIGAGREDEIGILSQAFSKMARKIQEKEEDLMAQNEELLAQQDELQAQQLELEEALETRKQNEEKLKNRNLLINQISNSLDKQDVLESIVANMCKIIDAEKGIIALYPDKSNGSYGVSESGIKQFLHHMDSGLYERLSAVKEPFTIRRELTSHEKGYHEGDFYCHDLYLPVLSSGDDVAAVMVFTRYGYQFEQSSLDEYMALAKNIGISLDKISLYEKSEEDRKRNQDILDTIKEGIQLINSNGMILQINDQLCEMFNEKDISLIGMGWEEWTARMAEFVEEKEFSLFLQKAVHPDVESFHSENTFIYRLKDGKKIIKVYSEVLFKGEEKLGTVLVHRDITKEYEVDQIKSEFVSTVSHELRTPLASILGFTELMLNRELKPERQKKYLSTIFNEAKRLTALINDFLDVQRMEAGKLTYEKKYIELKPILEKVIELQKINAEQHDITLESCVSNPLILGDRTKIEQVFTNLINNAIKYSPVGGKIKILVYLTNDSVKIDVKDNGLGIPKDSLDKLFTKFYRVDNSDRRRIGGTGLGLAIVQEIMKAHDGKVSVESEYGKGSTFTVSFPTVQGRDDFMEQEKGKEQADRYQIMVVEDDISLAGLMIQELQESGFSVSAFKRGKEALDYMKHEIPDSLVLDIMLEDNEMDGWSLMKEMKQDSRLQHIPIIISSALDDKEKGFSLGAKEYLVKPYETSQLSKAIMQTLLKVGKIGQILVPQNEDSVKKV